MPYISTEWDYDLKTEVFKVNGDKGYTHETDTLLTELTHEAGSGVDPERSVTKIEYFTADFLVDVKRDLSNSQVVFYDNGSAIPCYVNDNKQNGISWGLNTPPTTVTLALGYDVEHKIYAKYLGNKKALPSKSPSLTLYEPMPNLYTTKIERTTSTVQFQREVTITLPIKVTTGTAMETQQVKEVTLYDSENVLQTIEITILANTTYGEGTFRIQGGLPSGLHHLIAKFEGDEYNEEATLKFDISVGYEVLIADHSPVFAITKQYGTSHTPDPTTIYNVDVGYVDCEVHDWFGNPLVGQLVRLGDTDVPLGQGTTNAEGKVRVNVSMVSEGSFNASIMIIPSDIFTPTRTYVSEDCNVPVIKVTEISVETPSTVTAENHTLITDVQITKYQWIANPRDTLEGIAVTYNEMELGTFNGVAYTDKEGHTQFSYYGTGAGQLTVEIVCGSSLPTMLHLQDVTQFWSTTSASLNKQYTHIRDGKMSEVASGFKFQSVVGTGIAWIGVGDGANYDNDWELSYVVVSASTKLRIFAATWKYINNSPMRTPEVLSGQANFRRGDTITISYKKSTKTITIKTPYNKISKNVVRNGFPAFGIKSTVKASMIVNNVKFRRW